MLVHFSINCARNSYNETEFVTTTAESRHKITYAAVLHMHGARNE